MVFRCDTSHHRPRPYASTEPVHTVRMSKSTAARCAARRGSGDTVRHAKSACRQGDWLVPASRRWPGWMRRRRRGVGRRDRRRACARAGRRRGRLGRALSASLRAGLTAIDAAYAVLHTVDTPDVGADVVRRVLDAARSSASGLARARYGDRPGHPVVIARRHWPNCSTGFAATRVRGHSCRAARRCRRGGLRRPGTGRRHRRQLDRRGPATAAANRRTDCSAIAAASPWPSRARVLTVAVDRIEPSPRPASRRSSVRRPPRCSRCRTPTVRATRDVVRVGLTEVGQRRAVVDAGRLRGAHANTKHRH